MSKYTHVSLTQYTGKLPNLIEHPEFAKNGDPACAIYMEDREVLFCMLDGSCCAYSSFICPEYSLELTVSLEILFVMQHYGITVTKYMFKSILQYCGVLLNNRHVRCFFSCDN
jgi:hypothetical protein